MGGQAGVAPGGRDVPQLGTGLEAGGRVPLSAAPSPGDAPGGVWCYCVP